MRLAVPAFVAAVMAAACGGSKPSPSPTPAPGAIVVRGTERLGWNQEGDVATLRFVAYVDDRAVALAAAVCDGATPHANCSSPLPPLTDGVHTIALATVETSGGLESVRSEAITVQKVRATAALGAAALPDATARPGALRLDTVVQVSGGGGETFTLDVVARGLRAPAQLAWSPDGRLFISDADARIRIVRPGEDAPADPMVALDAPAQLDPALDGPAGIALHPHFANNHFVYLSFLVRDTTDQAALRIVRVREVGDTLGEPATLFEAPLTGTPATRRHARLAFGPDGLLYVALPPGVEFDGQPTASTPHASMLRMEDDGRVPRDIAPLTGIVTHPLGFDWHPTTLESAGGGGLWVAVAGDDDQVVVRPIAEGSGPGYVVPATALQRAPGGVGLTGGALLLRKPGDGSDARPVQAFVSINDSDALGVVGMTTPVLAAPLMEGMLGRLGDIVAGESGTLFVATVNGDVAGQASGSADDVVVRLRVRQ